MKGSSTYWEERVNDSLKIHFIVSSTTLVTTRKGKQIAITNDDEEDLSLNVGRLYLFLNP